MKRKNEKVPEFDEIIFEKRNKQYGAYNLRKHYKSVTSFSILSGIGLAAIVVILLSFTAKREIVIPVIKESKIVMTDPLNPRIIPPETAKLPSQISNILKNLKPEVVTDTSQATNIPITESFIGTIQDKPVTDTIVSTDPTTPEIPKEEVIFIKVEEDPEFPGGIPALMKFVGENLRYPSDAQINNIQGKVILKFVVNPDGSVGRIEIMRSVDSLLDNEAIRVVNTLPKFKPGKQGGVPVKVWFMLPVSFKLQN